MKISPAKIDEAARAIAEKEDCVWDDTDGWRYYFNDTHREQYRRLARAAAIAFGLSIEDEKE